MITSVKLENWKSHERTELRFGEGTNILVGPNGGGKTSVLEAISFALFGTVPKLKKRTIKQEELIRDSPQVDRATVEVSFQGPDGGEFTVKREIRRGSPSRAELRRDGELLAEGAERVTSYIQELLEMDYELYERAVYSEQDQLDLLLTEKDRKRKIDELLGIDKLEEARKKAGSLGKMLATLAGKGEERLATLRKEGIEDKLRELGERIRDLERRLAEEERRKEEVERELQSKDAEFRTLQQLDEELVGLEKRLHGVREYVRAYRVQRDRLREILGPQAEYPVSQLQEEARRLSEGLEEVSKKKKSVEEAHARKLGEVERAKGERDMHLSQAKQLAAEINKKLEIAKRLQELNPERVEAELRTLQETENRLVREKAEIRAQLEEIARSLEELQHASAKCPVCESPLDEGKKLSLLSSKRDKLEELKRREEELRREGEQVERERRTKEQLWREAERLRIESEGREELERERARHLERAAELERDLKIASDELALLNSTLTGLRREEEEMRTKSQEAERRVHLREQLESLEKELEKNQAEELKLNQLLVEKRKRFDERRLRTLEAELARLREERGKLESSVRGLREMLTLERERARELEAGRKEMRRLEAEVKHTHLASEYFLKVQQALAHTQAVLREEFVEVVNDLMGRLWSEIYPYGDFTGLALRVKDGEYLFQLRNRRGDWVDLEGPVSGGERAAACLTMRMAFALALSPKLGWIVLDEPTHNLDRNVIAEVAEMLRERLPEEIKQVILITHEEALEAAASGYLYRLSREKSKGEPTRVELVSSIDLGKGLDLKSGKHLSR
ncbi:MAG: SMC family ATPase [Candidatus Hadarchaeales archaeon]